MHGMGVRPRQRFCSVIELYTALYKETVQGQEPPDPEAETPNDVEIVPESEQQIGLESVVSSDKEKKMRFLEQRKMVMAGGGMAALLAVAVIGIWQPWKEIQRELLEGKGSTGILTGSIIAARLPLPENC